MPLTLLSLGVVLLSTGVRVVSSEEPVLASEKIISQAIASMSTATSAAFDIKATVNSSKLSSDQKSELADKFRTKVPGTIVLTAKGAFDESDTNNPRMSMKSSFTAGSLKGAFDFRLVNEMLYGQLTKAPRSEGLPFLKEVEKKWVLFPDFKIQKNSLSQAQQVYIINLARNAHLVKVTDASSSQKVSGVDARVISFDLDRPGIVAYIGEVEKYLESVGQFNTTFRTELSLEDLALIQDFKGKVWIGKKDNLPYKFSLSFTATPYQAEGGNVKINLMGTLKNWNKPVRVTVPSKTTSIKELMKQIREDF